MSCVALAACTVPRDDAELARHNLATKDTETLGDIGIELARGSGIVQGGVGLVGDPSDQPRTLSIDVPGAVRQVLIYWEAQNDSSEADDDIIVDGVPISGTLAGGPTKFFSGAWSATYGADITDRGLVSEGANSLSVEGLESTHCDGDKCFANGVGMLVVYDDGSGLKELSIRDGNDCAFTGFEPPLDTTVPQTFEFAPAEKARTARLNLLATSVGNDRPNVVEVTVGDTVTRHVDVLHDTAGPEFDAIPLDVDVPAGETSATVQLLSEKDPSSELDSDLPASLTWLAAGFAIEPSDLKLFVDKSTASTDTKLDGDRVSYTIDFGNNADVVANDVVITDDIPEGVEFESCTGPTGTEGDCIVEDGTVTWHIGDLEPGAKGSVTLTGTITFIPDLETCEICNTATITSNGDDTDATHSSTACVDVNPRPDPAGANAHESAFGARVQVDALGLASGVDRTLTPVSSNQSGIGSDGQSDELGSVSVEDVLEVGLLRTTSSSTVKGLPGARARHQSTAEALDVNILGGTVTADVVRAVSTATATGSSATFNAAGSTIKNLEVNGVAVDDVTPNTRIELPASVFGEGSYVVLFEQCTPDPDDGPCTGDDGSVATPGSDQRQGGTYASNLEVNMIRVHVTDLAGVGAADVVVSNAVARADFPQTAICGELPPRRAVSGDARITSARTDPSIAPVTVGHVEIPATGGSDHQNLDEASVPESEPVATNGTAVSDTAGIVADTETAASSFAEVENVCLLPGDSGSCAVSADLVRSEANSSADGDAAVSNDGDGDGDGDTLLAGLEILGRPVLDETPEPNTTIEVPGVGFLVLNEQFCDNDARLVDGCADGTGRAGLTVRALRLVVLDPASGGIPGAEVIVSEAHADAAFGSN